MRGRGTRRCALVGPRLPQSPPISENPQNSVQFRAPPPPHRPKPRTFAQCPKTGLMPWVRVGTQRTPLPCAPAQGHDRAQATGGSAVQF